MTGKKGRPAGQTPGIKATGQYYSKLIIPSPGPKRKSELSDLDTVLARVRGAYFDARAAGDLAQAARAAATYRVLFARKLRAPAPATLPAALPDRATWTAYRAKKGGADDTPATN